MLRKLFGKGRADVATGPEIAARERYQNFELRAAPIKEGGVWRVAGSIVNMEKEGAEPQPFVRADTCASHEDAVAISLRKARQLVDEQPL